MIVTQLYIEGNRIDLFKEDEININSSIQNVKDIAKVFTDFTKSFSIPATKENNKIFKHFYNFNIDNGFDARTKKSASIELNGVPFKKGKIKLDAVEVREGKARLYKISFFGNTINLKDVLGDDTFNTIATSFLNQFDQVYKASTVLSSLQNAVTVGSYTDAVLTPLISNTTRFFYDSAESNPTPYATNGVPNKLGGNLFAHSGDGSTHYHGAYYEELKYAIRIHILIKAIEEHYGITFSSDFFNTDNDVYHNLYMWLHRKAGRAFESVISESQLSGDGTTNGITSGTLPSSPSDQVNGTVTSDGSTCTYNYVLGVFQVDVQMSLTSSVATPPMTFLIKKNGQVVHEQFFAADSSSPYTSSTTYTEIFYNEYSSTEPEGEPVEFEFFVKSDEEITFSSGFVKFTIEGDLSEEVGIVTKTATFALAGATTLTNDLKFKIQEQIPEIKVIDFLTSIFKMFNLTAYEEDDGTIKVQTLDDFYRSSIKEWDLTEHLETNYNVNPSLPFKEIDFGYQGLETYLAQDHFSRFGKEWATDEYKNNEDESATKYDALGDVYRVEPKFEHLKYERLFDNADNQTLTDIQVGWFVSDSESTIKGKPLLFYPIKVNNGTEIRFLNDQEREDSSSHTDIDDYYVPSNSVSLSGSTSTQNINFKLEQNEYDFQSNISFDGTLFNLFYKSYIQKVFNVKNRIIKLSGYLPINFILNHTLADKINFKGNRYIINSLKINMSTGKSSVELLNDIKVANEFLVSSPYTTALDACSSSELNTKVYYDLNTTFANGVVLYKNESLSIPFDGNDKFFKLNFGSSNESIQVSSVGVVSNYSSC